MEHLLWGKNRRTCFYILCFQWLTSASFQLVSGTTWRLWEHSTHCMWWIMCGRLSLASSLFQDGIIVLALQQILPKPGWDISLLGLNSEGILSQDVSLPVSNPERPVEKIHNTKAQRPQDVWYFSVTPVSQIASGQTEKGFTNARVWYLRGKWDMHGAWQQKDKVWRGVKALTRRVKLRCMI